MAKSAKTRNAEATKLSVLQAAELIFAERGFAGASIREISEKSGVSGPLILFHFKNKEGIYEAVKTAIIQRYADGQCADSGCTGSIRSFVGNMIDSMFVFYRDNPTMLRLANWDHLEGAVDPWPGEDELHHVYEKRLREAQLRGEIRDDMSPFHISAIICGAVRIWWEFHAHFIKHAGKADGSAVMDEEYARQLLNFMLRGLSPSLEEKLPGIRKIRCDIK